MNSDELKALRARWYAAAREDGSLDLCRVVARALGRRVGATYGPKYEWEEAGVRVYLDDYGRHLTAHFAGRLVASTHDTDRLFVPGAWVDVVRGAAVRARAKNERDEHRREEAERRRLLDQLGVSDAAAEYEGENHGD